MYTLKKTAHKSTAYELFTKNIQNVGWHKVYSANINRLFKLSA